MTPADTAATFLQTYAAGGEVAEGWLFARAVRQCRLDYSPESLARLDDLLRQARERAKPSSEQLAGAKGRNFTALVAFYLIEMLRRRTGARLHWHDRASALRLLPPGTPVPDVLYTRMLVIGADQGAAFWPLSWVEGQLLPEGQRSTAAAYLDDLVRMMERDAPVAWWPATEAAGRMASWLMMLLATGEGPVGPATSNSKEPTVCQVQGRDGFIDEPGVRLAAIIVDVETYGDQPLRMTLAFPYRPATNDAPFAILKARLRDANAPGEKLAMLQGALDRGIQDVAWPAGASWNALYID